MSGRPPAEADAASDDGSDGPGRGEGSASTAVLPAVLPTVPAAPGPYAERSRRRRFGRRSALLSAVLIVFVGLGAGAGWLLLRATGDEVYLEALRAEGLGGQFASDAVAVAHGKRVCTGLRGGEKPQGMPEDKVAVRVLCPEFLQGFHVLENVTVSGTFTLHDYSYSYYSSGIAASDGSCTGSRGYDDIGEGTEVVVKNGSGTVLTTASLGPGSGDSTECTFDFSFEILEGEDDYAVSVGRRGEQHYSFTTLRNTGVHLTLGD